MDTILYIPSNFTLKQQRKSSMKINLKLTQNVIVCAQMASFY